MTFEPQTQTIHSVFHKLARAVQYCDLTLPSPAENLACEEALLDLCEEGYSSELLRFWEPADYFVVLGYANHSGREVNLEFCRQAGIPVLRRCTGGGTVLQGPGCLNYSLVLSTANREWLQSIPATNQFVLKKHQTAISELLAESVDLEGETDLTTKGVKFSGNAQRRKRNHLLFHGTYLLGLNVALMEKVLPLPSKQPAYRANRSHAEFLVNLQIDRNRLKEGLRKCWGASEQLRELPFHRTAELVKQKYSLDEWNLKF